MDTAAFRAPMVSESKGTQSLYYNRQSNTNEM